MGCVTARARYQAVSVTVGSCMKLQEPNIPVHDVLCVAHNMCQAIIVSGPAAEPPRCRTFAVLLYKPFPCARGRYGRPFSCSNTS